MKNKKSLKGTTGALINTYDQPPEIEESKTLNEKMIAKIRQHVASLSYEESLMQLDALLSNLQDENLPLTNLQNSYVEAKIYLEHCESLLNSTEQEVINMIKIGKKRFIT